MKRGPKWSIAMIAVTVVAAAASASPASASVTIGQIGIPSLLCGQLDALQPTVSSGNTYVVPTTGTVTSWSHNAGAGAGQVLTMKVFRKLADPLIYQVVGHDGPRALAGGLVNTFPASIPVKPGDVLGLGSPEGAAAAKCAFSAPGQANFLAFRIGSLADGTSAAFTGLFDNRVNATAVVEPSNSFDLGKAKLNKKKGKATLSVEVPNPGALILGGKGVKGASAAGAVVSKKVGAAGTVKLVIKAKGKQAKKLKKNGKVKLKAKITYTPTGGAPATQTKKLKLKRKKR